MVHDNVNEFAAFLIISHLYVSVVPRPRPFPSFSTLQRATRLYNVKRLCHSFTNSCIIVYVHVCTLFLLKVYCSSHRFTILSVIDFEARVPATES